MKKTKEEIAKDWNVFFTPEGEEVPDVLESMEEYKDQELEELQAKYDKLKKGFDFVKNDLLIILKENVRRVNEENFHKLYNEQAGLTE